MFSFNNSVPPVPCIRLHGADRASRAIIWRTALKDTWLTTRSSFILVVSARQGTLRFSWNPTFRYNVHHALSWITSILLTATHPTFFRYIWTSYSHLILGLPNDLSTSILRLQFYVHVCLTTSPHATCPDYFLLIYLVTWMYLLASTRYDKKEHECQSTRPLTTDVILCPSIVLCPFGSISSTRTSYSVITIVLWQHTRHICYIKLYKTAPILCTC
jgi:hypothetical protein